MLAEAVRWAQGHAPRIMPVRNALTFLWGCGPECRSTAALVNVSSGLARLKSGLMQYFEARGMAVETTLWGGTAHIQTVW